MFAMMFALLCAIAQGAWAADRNYEYPTKTKPSFYAEYGGKSNVVVINTLADRTFYKDGDWNTLCLPFSVANLSGTPLDGATLMALSTSLLAQRVL